MISELLLPDLLLTISNGTIQDKNDYFSALYQKQESWATAYFGETYLGSYTPDHNMGSMKMRDLPFSSWLEFQQFITDAYTTASGFIPSWVDNLDSTTLLYYLNRAGINTRSTSTVILTASDGTVLAHGLVTPASWEAAWNNLRVPYERTTVKNPTFPYIKYIQTYSSTDFFRLSTLKFDGTA